MEVIPGQKKPSVHSTGFTITGAITPGGGGEVELSTAVEFTLTDGVGGVELGIDVEVLVGFIAVILRG